MALVLAEKPEDTWTSDEEEDVQEDWRTGGANRRTGGAGRRRQEETGAERRMQKAAKSGVWACMRATICTL